jgi:hypothetical protein
LMSVYSLDLVIVDQELEESTGIDYCAFLRTTSYARIVPIVIIAPDDDHGTNCMAAYAAGADDYVPLPFVFGVCLAKVKYHLRRGQRRQPLTSTMSVNVSGPELPGVLQFLEVEQKTGKLAIRGLAGTATLTIDQGRLVNASAPHCTGLEVIPEVLSWESCTLVFQDLTLTAEDKQLDEQLTRALMNAAVEVDEYRDRRKQQLPPADVTFAAGPVKLPQDHPKAHHDLFRNAVDGYSRDELLQDPGLTERQATSILLDLLEQGYLVALDPPYRHYTRLCYEAYVRLSIDPKLDRLRDDLMGVEFPLPPEPPDVPPASVDWTVPAPLLLIVGNKPDHGHMLLESFCAVFRAMAHHRPARRKHLGGLVCTRLLFPNQRLLDVAVLPAVLDRATLAWLDPQIGQVVGVLFIASDQDRFHNLQNLRAIRLLRQRFKGVYYHVVPRIMDGGVAIFKMDCSKCGYKLAVDIDGVGDTGICPICNTEIIMPDCLDNLARVLHLPREVPVVQARPDDPRHARDLFLLVLDTVLYSAHHPENAETIHQTAEFHKVRMPQGGQSG